MPKKKKKSGKLVTVDFKDVETRELVPEGDYQVKVKDITEEEGDKGPYLNWVLNVSDGEYKGKVLYYTTSLTKQSLWNLRAVLEALGLEVPKSKMTLDLPSYHGLEMGVTVEIETFKKKEKNVVVDVWNLEDADEDGDEEGDSEKEDDDDGDEDSGDDDGDDEGDGDDSGDGDDDGEEEITGTISAMEEDVLTIVLDEDGEEVDVYTEDADVSGTPDVGSKITATGSYDEDEDFIATEVKVKKAKSKSKSKKSESKKNKKKK